VADHTGRLNLTFFNQKFTTEQLRYGEEYIFYGTLSGDYVGYGMTSPVFESLNTKNQLRGPVSDSANGPNMRADLSMGEISLGIDVKALDDLTSKDVLASPRVTTLPDEPVEIKLVTQTYFVEDFDDPETEKTTAEKTTVEKTTVEKTTEEKTTAEETTEEKTTKPRDEEPTTDKPESTTAPEDDEVIGTYKVIRAVNVRDDAGEDNARLGSIKVGETVKAYDSKKAPSGVTWIQIDFDGEKGWISTNFVEKIS
jgi:RecG-like helicase